MPADDPNFDQARAAVTFLVEEGWPDETSRNVRVESVAADLAVSSRTLYRWLAGSNIQSLLVRRAVVDLARKRGWGEDVKGESTDPLGGTSPEPPTAA